MIVFNAHPPVSHERSMLKTSKCVRRPLKYADAFLNSLIMFKVRLIK